MDYVIETPRLGLRRIQETDFDALYAFLGDPEVMYAWEHGFSQEGVRAFIANTMRRYHEDGFAHFAAIEKASGTLIGAIGPIVEVVEDLPYIGLGYILHKGYWGMGYALEGAAASMQYAFDVLGAEKVIAEIRPENLPSQKVAQTLGMTVEREFVKHYRGTDMPHLIYSKTSESLRPLGVHDFA